MQAVGARLELPLNPAKAGTAPRMLQQSARVDYLKLTKLIGKRVREASFQSRCHAKLSVTSDRAENVLVSASCTSHQHRESSGAAASIFLIPLAFQEARTTPAPTGRYLEAQRHIGRRDEIVVVPGHFIDPEGDTGAPGERDFNKTVSTGFKDLSRSTLFSQSAPVAVHVASA
jgi:hypothetical protein